MPSNKPNKLNLRAPPRRHSKHRKLTQLARCQLKANQTANKTLSLEAPSPHLESTHTAEIEMIETVEMTGETLPDRRILEAPSYPQPLMSPNTVL